MPEPGIDAIGQKGDAGGQPFSLPVTGHWTEYSVACRVIVRVIYEAIPAISDILRN